MTDSLRAILAEMPLDKALAIAAYGESVAAYRYRCLAKRTADEKPRSQFDEITKECFKQAVPHTKLGRSPS